MDKKYLEFWGNYFLSAARSQEQLEELARLAKQGFNMMEEQWGLFRKFYGMVDSAESDVKERDRRQKSFADFKKGYKEFLELMGAVPKEEYDELVSRYEALKKEVAERKKTGRLSISDEMGYDPDELAKGVQDLIKRQSEQFEELMNAFGLIYAKKQHQRRDKK
jgi:hypothetical protein